MFADWQLKQSCIANKDRLFIHRFAIFILLYAHLEVVGDITLPQ